MGTSTNLTNNNQEWHGQINGLQAQFIREMDDDFNTANGISILFELSKLANLYLLEKNTSEVVIQGFMKEFENLFSLLGLQLENDELLDEEIEALLEERIQARKNRDFKRSDEIRDTLKEMNIILEDTAQGTRWKRG